MAFFTQEQRDKIVKALNERGVNQPCPRCRNLQFSIGDGLFNHNLSGNASEITLGGVTLPVVVTICNRCGFVSEHALGALGLMEEFQKKEGERNG